MHIICHLCNTIRSSFVIFYENTDTFIVLNGTPECQYYTYCCMYDGTCILVVKWQLTSLIFTLLTIRIFSILCNLQSSQEQLLIQDLQMQGECYMHVAYWFILNGYSRTQLSTCDKKNCMDTLCIYICIITHVQSCSKARS